MSSFGAWLRALFGRFGLALVLCVAVAAGAVVVVNRYIDDQVDKVPRVQLATAPVGQNGMNFLIVGSDSRSWIENPLDYQAFSDSSTQNAPPRSDTMMVVHVEPGAVVDAESWSTGYLRSTFVVRCIARQERG